MGTAVALLLSTGAFLFVSKVKDTFMYAGNI